MAVKPPLTSMGDIAFLLIIFFMLCSNFANEPGELEHPEARELETMEEGRVSVAIDADKHIYLNGTRVSSADEVEQGVAALIEGRESREGRTVMFKCHKEVGKATYEPVLEAIASAGGLIAAAGKERAGP